MLKSKILSLIDFVKNTNILITSHDSTDIDGFASSIALKHLLNKKYEQREISCYFSKISKATKDFIKKFRAKFPEFSLEFATESPNLQKYETLLILDTNNPEQVPILPKFKESGKDKSHFYIDHHINNFGVQSKEKSIIYDEISSTAELISQFYQALDESPPKEIRFLLVAAILTDSGFFKHGTSETIAHASQLLNQEVPYQEILHLLKREKKVSEKIARIKGLQRVQLIRCHEWLLGISHIGSYEAEVASTLVKIGFDVSVVLSRKKKEFRISTRAKKRVCKEMGLHLGKILEEIANKHGISGGGHDGAAAINGENNAQRVQNEIIGAIKQILNN